jgi:ATP phosphoribosyltransferase
MNRKEAADDDLFTVVIQKFFFDNTQDLPDLPHEEIEKNGRPIEVATKAPNILEKYFKDHESRKLDGEARLIIHQ